MRGEGPELCLALAKKRANGARGGPPALARNGGDGVTHKLARKVGHAEQIVFNRQRKILPEENTLLSATVCQGKTCGLKRERENVQGYQICRIGCPGRPSR